MKRTTLAALAIPAAITLAACGGQNEPASGSGNSGGTGSALAGEVLIDGSSTVGPLSIAAGEAFKQANPGVNVSVGQSGTGGGFKKFCAGQTDISDASRPIKDEEKEMCAKAGIEYAEIVVANDALTIVANKDNTFLTCLTTAQLKTLWEPAAEGKILTWDQVDPTFPKEKLALYGAGTDSGTFDYFTAAINGEEGASRTDYAPTEDDNLTVQGVSGDVNALGYFGFTYFEENEDKLKAVAIDSGKGCVAPSVTSAQDGTYSPLSRPLFIYVATKSAATKPHVKAFVDYYVSNDATIAEAARYVGLNSTQQAEAKAAAASLG